MNKAEIASSLNDEDKLEEKRNTVNSVGMFLIFTEDISPVVETSLQQLRSKDSTRDNDMYYKGYSAALTDLLDTLSKYK